MRWKKRGRIFDPAEYGFHYAKSPQAVAFEKFVRVYFSYCEKDNGKVISCPAYVDFTNDFEKIIEVSKHSIIQKGALGCYDEHGIFPFSPFKDNNRLLAYLSGVTRRVSVSVDSGIGIAESLDGGKTFKRLGDGPVLTAALNEPFLVIDGFVRKWGDLYHMWYIFGTEWGVYEEGYEAERTYKIGHAYSTNGVSWIRDIAGGGKQIIVSQEERECQALPTVIEYHGCYHMYFCYRNTHDFKTNTANSYRLGYAKSKDLVNWHRDDALAGIGTSDGGWDSEMLCYPNLFQHDGELYLLYNGNGFGESGFGIAKMEDYI